MIDARIAGSGGDARPTGEFRRPQGGSDIRESRSPAITATAGPHGCTGQSSKGGWCAAYPVKGTDMCAGHTRSANA